jgi:phage FluMu protein Com
MSPTTVVCPHCGKKLANAEKLAWHLSRECPAFRPREDRQRPVEDENSNAPAER